MGARGREKWWGIAIGTRQQARSGESCCTGSCGPRAMRGISPGIECSAAVVLPLVPSSLRRTPPPQQTDPPCWSIH